MLRSALLLLVLLAAAAGCGGQMVYPARPPATPGLPIADPPPSKVIVHVTVTADALRQTLERVLPREGAGTFALRGERQYSWRRGPLELAFSGRNIVVRAPVSTRVELPLVGTQSFLADLRAAAEPVVSSDYRARLQGVAVTVTSEDIRLRAAQGLAGMLDTLGRELASRLESYAYDLRPLVAEAYARLARPIDLPLGEAHGCAELRVTAVEAGPTLLAGGVEKDLALVVTPSVTLPCAAPPTAAALPPLANVAMLPTGPFVVTIPVAARYEELQRAMKLAFTDGKLHFSKELPELFMSDPEVYAASDQLVLKVRLAGPVKKGPIHTTLDGDIYFAGHPAVVDNELLVPDLQPTIDTSSFLLRLKAALDGDSIRDQARQALRLDIGERLRSVRQKLSTDLAIGGAGAGQGCLRADVPRIVVTGVHPHGGYLRVYVDVTAQASVYLPCPTTAATVR